MLKINRIKNPSDKKCKTSYNYEVFAKNFILLALIYFFANDSICINNWRIYMVMDILSILQLLGGIGLFLIWNESYGFFLEKLAGSGLERILEKLTTGKNKAAGYVKGLGLGTGVTAIIQSSAATTIMLIGFVNAGIMKLHRQSP